MATTAPRRIGAATGLVDPNEPILPGHVTTAQAWNFGKALLRGQKDGWEIVKTLAKDRIREVI